MNETILRGLKCYEEYAELWSTLDRCNWIDITGHGKRIYPGWNRWIGRQLLQEILSVFKAYKWSHLLCPIRQVFFFLR